MAEERVDDLPVDFERLPEELQALAPFVRRWGVADDKARETRVEVASDGDLRALSDVFAPHWEAINRWLDEHDAEPDRYEATVLSAASEAALEAQLELDGRGRVGSVKNAEQVRQVLARQLAMNQQSWQALQEQGVTEESELRLDFFYVAPGEREAESLRAFLGEETDYDVRVDSSGGGFMRKKSWMVTGTTQPTKVSLDILNEWVEWMVAAGFECDCQFDGWGAQAG